MYNKGNKKGSHYTSISCFISNCTIKFFSQHLVCRLWKSKTISITLRCYFSFFTFLTLSLMEQRKQWLKVMVQIKGMTLSCNRSK